MLKIFYVNKMSLKNALKSNLFHWVMVFYCLYIFPYERERGEGREGGGREDEEDEEEEAKEEKEEEEEEWPYTYQLGV